MEALKPVKECESLRFGRYECDELYNCCSCGGNDCGCRYCHDCNACEVCLEDE